MSLLEASPSNESTAANVLALEAEITSLRTQVDVVTRERDLLLHERDRLRASHERLRLELELLRRRIFAAKAERVDTAQLELEFAEKLRELDALAGMPGGLVALAGEGEVCEGEGSGDAPPAPPAPDKPARAKPKGRRDPRLLNLEEERIELTDPVYEALVEEGKARRIGFEESSKLAWKRGGMRCLVVARVKYQVVSPDGSTTVDTAPLPEETFARSLAAPSLLAHVLVDKFCDGLPLFRIEERFRRDGVGIDRGTLSRWVDDAGATFGATVIHAARAHAMRTAFCISTDATGMAIQPERDGGKRGRRACRRGHYFAHLADLDHVFFEYTPKETSGVVSTMFRGFQGYVQADAKAVYDALFRPPEPSKIETDADGAANSEPPRGVPKEVGCWAHSRRKFWESACAKNVVAREALARIGRFFTLDESWRQKPPRDIHRLRNAHLRPHLVAFFEWAQVEHDKVRDERGALRSALGYALRQQAPLLRVLDDGRLKLDNNHTERELRRVAVNRRASLFAGSDGHAESAGHVLSMVASAKLHGLDPETYLRDILRVLAHWPKNRYLELAAVNWTATRARLDPTELAAELGPLTVPDAITPAE